MPPKLLVEEELVESVFTWEMPYQLLQLILTDLLMQLESLKADNIEDEDDDTDNESAADTDVTPTADSAKRPKRHKRATSSIGMVSELIMQIQDDALERKNKRWREELTGRLERHIAEVEAAIMRYERANHGGLTFKPSTMKADVDLSYLGLNLHQQLFTVGNAMVTSWHDISMNDDEGDLIQQSRFESVDSGDDEDGNHSTAARYMRLVESAPVSMNRPTFNLPPVTEHESEGASLSDGLPDSNGSENKDLVSDEVYGDDMDDIDENEEDEDVEGDEDELTALGDDVVEGAEPPEPREALRRRLISFDSAEHIVHLYASGSSRIPVSREQRELAESIVALGLENVLEMEIADNEKSDPLDLESDDSEVEVEEEASTIEPKPEQPFSRHALYATTTVGAFAAHVYGFKKGGIRQLRAQLRRLRERMAKERERPGSDLTVEGLERECLELKWQIDRRLEVVLCQSMSALVTCFQQTLYVQLHTHGLEYLERLSEVGFLFSVESLLSTYRHEAGMLGDMDAAIRHLEQVRIKLRPVQSSRAAQFRVSMTTSSQGLVMELPLIVEAPSTQRSMHRIPGQDALTGAVYFALVSDEDWRRARNVFRHPISVVPVLFSQGINELQTVANTVGKDTLQKEINAENLVVLERYVKDWLSSRNSDGVKGDVSTPDGDALVSSLCELRGLVERASRGKHMDILTLSSAIARRVGGGRVTCCKSAKDRTAMSVTLEEATLLINHHDVRLDDRDHVTTLLRTHGVRRENARKNIGRAQYCFSALQNYLLPTDYQCPPGTGGGSSSLS
ncbi:hypothetical protein PINS_up005472 [Pythium insidiosum]|nr:hypothetical protein PINS_up005472 [Pythium insidiosum]